MEEPGVSLLSGQADGLGRAAPSDSESAVVLSQRETTSPGPPVVLGPKILPGHGERLQITDQETRLALLDACETQGQDQETALVAVRPPGGCEAEAMAVGGSQLVQAEAVAVHGSQRVHTEASAVGSDGTLRGLGLETEYELIRIRSLVEHLADRLEKVEEAKAGSFGSASSGRYGWVDHQALNQELTRQARVRELEAQTKGSHLISQFFYWISGIHGLQGSLPSSSAIAFLA